MPRCHYEAKPEHVLMCWVSTQSHETHFKSSLQEVKAVVRTGRLDWTLLSDEKRPKSGLSEHDPSRIISLFN